MTALLHELGHNPLLWLLAFVPAVFVGQTLEPEAQDVSEVFVESVQQAAVTFGMTPAFVGFIVVALVGGAAEMTSAFSGALLPPRAQ